MRRLFPGVLLLILASLVLLSGTATIHADGADTPTPTAPLSPPPFSGPGITFGGPGQVRVIHASPGTPNLDVYLSSMAAPIITNLAYGSATGFLTLPSATYIISIRLAGMPVNSAPLFQHTMILSPDSALNVI